MRADEHPVASDDCQSDAKIAEGHRGGADECLHQGTADWLGADCARPDPLGEEQEYQAGCSFASALQRVWWEAARCAKRGAVKSLSRV